MTRRGMNRVELAILAACLSVAAMGFVYVWRWEMLPRLMRTPDVWVLAILLLAGIPFAAWLQARFARTARLIVDEHGLTMQSGLPRFLQAGAMGDWVLRWEDIDRVTVLERLGVVHLRRKGRMIKSALPLRPGDWTPEGTAPAPTPLRDSPLWRALARHGVFDRAAPDPNVEAITFDLWRHPATRAALLACAALVAYAAAETVMRREAWAEWSLSYNIPHAVAGIGAAVAAAIGLLMATRGVPVAIGLFLALLVGSSSAIASYSALIRVNQALGGPLEIKPYRRNATCDALVPLEPGLPTIEYTELAQAYWCSHRPQVLHEVPVRKGLFGLYQVDLTEHTDAIRRFRAAH